MDKKNYSLNAEEKQELLKIIETVKEDTIEAMESAGIIQRKRKVKDCRILLEALNHYLVDQFSFRKLSAYMDCKHDIKLSATAWKKQLYKAIPVLREIAISYLSQRAEISMRHESQSFALDATVFSAQGSPGTAARVHTAVSLEDGICRYDHITDEHVAESVKNFPIQAGALYLADRAYGKAGQAAHMMRETANILFRFSPSLITLYKDAECKKKLDIDKLLHGTSFSKACYIKDKNEIFRVRIVGMLLPEEVHDAVEKKSEIPHERSRQRIPALTRFYMQSGYSC